MQLFYRGTKYDYTPGSLESAREANVYRALRPTFNLAYRGSVYLVDPNQEPHQSVARPVAPLSYRGVTYGLNGWTPAPANAVVQRLNRSFNTAPGTEVANIHRNNLYRNLQHRLQVAREKGDQNLISLLERELQQIA